MHHEAALSRSMLYVLPLMIGRFQSCLRLIGALPGQTPPQTKRRPHKKQPASNPDNDIGGFYQSRVFLERVLITRPTIWGLDSGPRFLQAPICLSYSRDPELFLSLQELASSTFRRDMNHGVNCLQPPTRCTHIIYVYMYIYIYIYVSHLYVNRCTCIYVCIYIYVYTDNACLHIATTYDIHRYKYNCTYTHSNSYHASRKAYSPSPNPIHWSSALRRRPRI